MYPQMVYHADVRAREKQLAAERQMGCSCSALGRMISRVITKCNGRVRYDERMDDYAMAYAASQTCYVRPAARTVTLATNNHHPANAHAVQPEPPRAHATTTLPGTPFPSMGAPPQGAGIPRKPKKKKKKKQVRFTPSGPVPADEPPPHAQHHTAPVESSGGAAAGTASVVYDHGAAEPLSYSSAPPAHGQGGQGYGGYGYGYGRYAPSPLPRWEMLGTPRRPEYFSSEYRWYYPTPVREGIYSFATDANGRLSTIFSEENPNACTIV